MVRNRYRWAHGLTRHPHASLLCIHLDVQIDARDTLANTKAAMPKVLQVDEEIYAHEYLWRSSTALIRVLASGADDAHHFALPAMLSTFLAYEAFVNYAGFVCRPDLWEDEKKNFKGKGLGYKLKTVADALPSLAFAKSDAKYQRIVELERFRDLVAHGKVHRTEYQVAPKPDGTHIRWKHEWDHFLETERIVQARKDIQSLCQLLVESMRKHFDHPHLFANAFDGPLASASGEGVG